MVVWGYVGNINCIIPIFLLLKFLFFVFLLGVFVLALRGSRWVSFLFSPKHILHPNDLTIESPDLWVGGCWIFLGGGTAGLL